jgi:hypothetical protein
MLALFLLLSLSRVTFSVAAPPEESTAPHLFTAPDVYRNLQSAEFALSADDRRDESMPFLTPSDLHVLRHLADMHAENYTATAARLQQQVCEIPRVEKRISLSTFMRNYGDAPAVISATLGVGELPFGLTPDLVEQLQPEGSLSPCLCYPEHGTNFFEHSASDSETYPKRYCLWQLPHFVELFFGKSHSTENRTQIPDAGEVMNDEQLVSNLELAKALAFQCRVGVVRFRRDNPGPRQRLPRTIVNSLGDRKRSYSSPVPRREADHHAAKDSWWGRANLDDEQHIHSAMLWLSTALTRTPMHSDNRMQFLVQLQGRKHVSVYPNTTELSTTEAKRLKRLAKSHGGPFDPSVIDEAERSAAAGRGLNLNRHGVQQCLLEPGEVLWLPNGAMHDVFSLEASMSLNMRFNSFAPIGTADEESRGQRSSKRRRRMKKPED